MDLNELKYCAKYPFTNSAKKLIAGMNLDFETISENDIDFAYQSLLNLLTKNYVNFKELENSKENYLRQYLISYPLSNMIINLSKSPYLKMKYARMKALQAKRFLNFESSEVFNKLSDELFQTHFEISYQDYLANLPKGEAFRLVYQNLKNGKITIDNYVLEALITEKAFNSIMKTQLVKIKYPKSIIYYAEDIKEKQKSATFSEDFGQVNMKAFPPCMRAITQKLMSGDAVGHIPKFVLVTFLIAIGMEDEEIIKIYSNQENFKRELTLYHIKHARGQGTSTIKYSAPSCAKMQTYGTCHRDSTCRWAHPLKFYKLTKDRMERKKK